MLPWLLGESPGTAIPSVLQNAEFMVTSDLTLIECDRAFYRACFLGEFSKDRSKSCGDFAGWRRDGFACESRTISSSGHEDLSRRSPYDLWTRFTWPVSWRYWP